MSLFEIFSFKNQVGSNKKFKGASNNNEIIAAKNHAPAFIPKNKGYKRQKCREKEIRGKNHDIAEVLLSH